MMAELPGDLAAQRHRDLAGRAHHPWYRRGLFALVSVLPLLALLNVFGQKPATSHAGGPSATFTVDAPDRLRGGLIYQARFEIEPLRDIQHVQLVLDRGWWEGMTENSVNPDPSTQGMQNGGVTLGYDPLQQGQVMVVWVQYQVNPTNVGHRPQGVELDDGTKLLARVARKVTIYP
jgi:hypothetical protein